MKEKKILSTLFCQNNVLLKQCQYQFWETQRHAFLSCGSSVECRRKSSTKRTQTMAHDLTTSLASPTSLSDMNFRKPVIISIYICPSL